MSNRGVIGINIIISIIIGSILLILGLVFFKTIVSNTGKTLEEENKDIEYNLKSLLVSSQEKVLVYPSSIKLSPGEEAVVGVGIKNVDDVGHNFKLEISCDPEIEAKKVNRAVYVESGDIKVLYAIIKVKESTGRGNYICNINVKESGKIYDNPRILSINVA